MYETTNIHTNSNMVSNSKNALSQNEQSCNVRKLKFNKRNGKMLPHFQVLTNTLFVTLDQ